MLFKLARKSLLNRKFSVALTVVSITVGIMLLISFGFIKDQVKSSFSKTISGIDLIVGPKTSDINLLLYSVFHVGSPTNNISWDSYERLTENDKVKGTIPVSLGDSHRGYRVIGTTDAYFNHYQYGNKQSLALDQGQWFDHPFEVVLGHDVAEAFAYLPGDEIVLAHGVGKTSFKKHDQIQFKVSGVLQPTGTPVDQSLFVSLTGLEAVHLNWPRGEQEQLQLTDHIIRNGLQPKSVTAVFVLLSNKSSTFVIQRSINQDKAEPLQAILPGVALAHMWNISAMFEKTLWLVGALVFVSTLIGLVNMLMASLQSRKKELALLRIIGASPGYCFWLIQMESVFIVMLSVVLAVVLSYTSFFFLGDWLSSHFGFFMDLSAYFNVNMGLMLLSIMAVTIVLVCVPATMFYRQSMLKNINQ